MNTLDRGRGYRYHRFQDDVARIPAAECQLSARRSR